MAEETVKSEEVVVVADKVAVETKEETKAEAVEEETTTKAADVAEEEAEEAKLEAEVAKEEAKTVAQSVSFKEETNVVADLPDPQTKALAELKQLIQDALNKREFVTIPPPPPPTPAVEEKKVDEPASAAVAAPEPAVTEEVKTEEAKAEEETTTATTTTEEAVKKEEEVEKVVEAEPVVKAEPVVTPEAAVVAAEVVETKEAIEETIVAVSTTTPDEETKEEEKPVAVEAEPAEPAVEAAEPVEPETASIWGIPLLADERTDVILLKFLRARDFKVKEAFTMIRNTVRWRKEFKIDELLEEDLSNTELDKVVYMKGVDREGHPVCYNIFGEFQNKDLYCNTLADEEKRLKFFRWRIQFLERSIRKLDFSPSGVSTIVQVNDLKNPPGPFKTELRLATNQVIPMLQDNYPEFVAKQVL